MWTAKLIVCIIVDLFDFTVGRLLFAVPFAGELIGAVVAWALFGKVGGCYFLEAIDLTEQIDGFFPTATIIALANRPKVEEVRS